VNETNKLVNFLRGNGLSKGDNFYFILPLLPELFIVNLAVIKAGLIGIPTATTLTLNDLTYRFSTYPPNGIITDEQTSNLIDDVLNKTNINPKIKIVVGEKKGWESYDSIKKESPYAEPAKIKKMMRYLFSSQAEQQECQREWFIRQ